MDRLQPGQMLGAYRIIGQAGQGGMAMVYKAYQASMDRYVAVKILPSELAESPEFAGRFQQEARTIAHLEHPRILPVFDYGESDGITYLVMRYLEAGTLKDRLAAGALSLEEIDRLFTQLADALSYAHGRGVIHRDLKPANALIDADDNVFLTDFGIAKILAGTAQFTKTDAVMGTPAYISPEQAQGRPVDRRSDIYSLGVILYEMVTGRVPYVADTPLAVIFMHVSDPLPLPSSIKPDVPPAIEQVILKALAKDPQDRFDTAAEFAAAWRRALAMRETTPEGPTAYPYPRPQDMTATSVSSRAPEEGTVLTEAPAPQAARRRVSPLLVGCVLVGCAVFGIAVAGTVFAATSWRTLAFLRPQASQTPAVTAVSSIIGGDAATQEFDVAIGDDISRDSPAGGAGVIEAPGSQDVYTFSADPEQQVYIQTIKTPNSGDIVDFYLTDELGGQVYYGCLQCGDPGVVVLEHGGKYTLTVGKAEPDGAGTGEYRFKLWPLPAPETFEIKLDDLISDGVPGAGAGHVESPGTNDRYTFTADPGQVVYFEVRQPPQTDDLLNWRLEDDAENRIFDTCLQCGDPGRITLDQGGDYTIIVGNKSGAATGIYKIIAWHVPPPGQFQIDIGATISKDAPGPGAGNIETPGAEDVYTFNASAGQQVQFLVKELPQTGDLLNWQLTDELGNDIFNTCLQCGDPGTLTLDRGGAYTLTVGSQNSAATGNYGVQVLAP